MLDETILLEKLRQKIEKVESEMGSSSDFIDKGSPNERQLKAAQNSIDSDKAKSELLKSQLREKIEVFRKERPQAIDEWVLFHKEILQRISEEPEVNVRARTRVSVARSTLLDWDKVLKGEKEYVGINWFYLKDYKAKAAKLVSKSWWKFWS